MIWKDKVRSEKLSETIQNACFEMFKGAFDEIKELDEEYFYTSGIQSGDNTDRILSEGRAPLQKHTESTASTSRQNNYHFNVKLDTSDFEDEKPQLLLSDIYEKGLATSQFESSEYLMNPAVDSLEENVVHKFKFEKQETQEKEEPEEIININKKAPERKKSGDFESASKIFNKRTNGNNFITCVNAAEDQSYLFLSKARSEERRERASSSFEKNAKKLKKLTSQDKLRSVRTKNDTKFTVSFTDSLKLNGVSQNSLIQAQLANSFKKDGDQNTHLENLNLRLSLFKNNGFVKKKNQVPPATPNKMSFEFSRLSKKSEDRNSFKNSNGGGNVFAKVQELIKRPVPDPKQKNSSYRSLKKNSFLI